MAKACGCGFILEFMERDARLACLPLAARMLWLVLVRRMQQMGQVGLVFGSEIPNQREIAMMVAVSETELETHLQPLLARGLLVRREDGALESPLLVARQKRAETARANGLRGGRPRKDGTPPRQREMVMGLPSAAASAPAKTQSEPAAVGFGSVAKLAKPSEEKAKLADLPADARRIEHAAMEAAGFDPVRWTGHCGLVHGWLRDGASEALILGTIRRVMARTSQTPGHFGFFKAAIEEAMKAEAVSPAVMQAAPVAASPRVAAFLAACEAWESAGRRGPPPVLAEAA